MSVHFHLQLSVHLTIATRLSGAWSIFLNFSPKCGWLALKLHDYHSGMGIEYITTVTLFLDGIL